MYGTAEHLVVYQCDKLKTRVGSKHDGGYVIIDDIGDYDFYFGLGVGDNPEFDNQFVSKYNVSGFCYDNTINNLPSFDNRLTYINKNISGVESSDAHTNLEAETAPYKNIFLKIDIEGYEWQWFKHMSDEHMQRYKQIVVEFHDWNTEGTTSEDKVYVFKRLATHFHLLHAHGNNHGDMKNYDGVSLPNVIELTYVRKDIIPSVKLNSMQLPSYLDAPCCAYKYDYDLNHYPFVHKTS
jgi:hypothetical protein